MAQAAPSGTQGPSASAGNPLEKFLQWLQQMIKGNFSGEQPGQSNQQNQVGMKDVQNFLKQKEVQDFVLKALEHPAVNKFANMLKGLPGVNDAINQALEGNDKFKAQLDKALEQKNLQAPTGPNPSEEPKVQGPKPENSGTDEQRRQQQQELEQEETPTVDDDETLGASMTSGKSNS